jgi:hypothetical protein
MLRLAAFEQFVVYVRQVPWGYKTICTPPAAIRPCPGGPPCRSTWSAASATWRPAWTRGWSPWSTGPAWRRCARLLGRGGGGPEQAAAALWRACGCQDHLGVWDTPSPKDRPGQCGGLRSPRLAWADPSGPIVFARWHDRPASPSWRTTLPAGRGRQRRYWNGCWLEPACGCSARARTSGGVEITVC